MTREALHIVRLEARNVKRLRAVTITPEGNLVIVGGKNGQGKSSVLDSIMYALGGKDAICAEPLRRGAGKGSVTLELGSIRVTRTFESDGSSEVVLENVDDGARHRSPQARLDNLVGRLSFDPLEFARLKPKEQADTLRMLVGLDFSKLDTERQEIFDHRTDVNREVRNLAIRLDAAPQLHTDVGEAEIPMASALADLELAQTQIRANDAALMAAQAAATDAQAKEKEVGNRREHLHDLNLQLADLRAKILKAEQGLTAATEESDALEAEAARRAREVNALQPVEVDPIKARIAQLETTNRKVRENASRLALEAEWKAKDVEAEKLTERIGSIDKAKQDAIASAQFPVDGLAFTLEGGITFAGLPFEQASAAEQLRVSVAIGLALNPRLRVLLIRDGSLLDADSLALVAELAQKANAQLWLERVEADGATVVIEDGMVAGAEVAS